MHVILFFIDGLGLAPAGTTNPLFTTPLPCLAGLLGGHPLTTGAVGSHNKISTLISLDASLGVEGEPQSATGQTALFTGINASEAAGRHVRGFPTPPLCKLLKEEGLLKKALEQGNTATFLNSYSPRFFQEKPRAKRAYSATTWLNLYAGLPFRTFEDLIQKNAVNMDITNEVIRDMGFFVPLVEPEEAGRILAEKAGEYDLLLFEYFLTDTYAHKRNQEKTAAILRTIDRFMTGIFAHLPLSDTLFILTSDHGNIEDLSTSAHTRNPVPLLLVGEGRDNLPQFTDLTDVTPFILQFLQK